MNQCERLCVVTHTGGILGKLVKVNYYHETGLPTKKLTGLLPWEDQVGKLQHYWHCDSCVYHCLFAQVELERFCLTENDRQSDTRLRHGDTEKSVVDKAEPLVGYE